MIECALKCVLFWLLVATTSLTGIVGMTLVVLGILLSADTNAHFSDLSGAMARALHQKNVHVANLGPAGPPNVRELLGPTGRPDLRGLLGSAGTASLTAGCLLLLVSLVCLMTSCLKRQVLYIASLVLVGACCLALVAAYANQDNIMARLKLKLKARLKTYSGIGDLTMDGLTFNSVMAFYKCCGLDDYRDFSQLDYWPPYDPHGRTYKTPVVCCKEPEESGCYLDGLASSANNWMRVGCFPKVQALLRDTLHLDLVFFSILFFFLLTAAALALLIIF
ncbi:tetraspanin-10 [Aplysia californica]|uniref:Tetraspanin-10 n=1 Tax=Aplysia californica TaxID=6500 RepID=A0ABM1A2X6_APLCA|nr:tetraspanin-10 [Aplysia californica]